jgi:hypothetical protein
MGLDVHAYSNIKRKEIQDSEDYDSILIFHDEFNRCELPEGRYEETPSSEYYLISCRAYSNYNRFRDTLSKAVFGVPASSVWEDLEKYQDQHFFEIIYFTDCDGVIGPKVNEKLYGDFVANRERVLRNLKGEIDFLKETEDELALEPEFILDLGLTEDTISYLMEVYDLFTKAFMIGKENGVVLYR